MYLDAVLGLDDNSTSPTARQREMQSMPAFSERSPSKVPATELERAPSKLQTLLNDNDMLKIPVHVPVLDSDIDGAIARQRWHAFEDVADSFNDLAWLHPDEQSHPAASGLTANVSRTMPAEVITTYYSGYLDLFSM